MLIAVALLGATVAATGLDGARLRLERRETDARNRRLAADLQLTDLCLFGDTPWLRHLAEADLWRSVSDLPGAFDYSRSGTLVAPRDTVMRPHGIVAEPPTISR